MHLFIKRKHFRDEAEFVERKGLGHPDTLADALAEKLSVEYSNYTLKHYGAVLHHNFDKLGLLGGASHVAFGEGYITRPIRVLLNGRASTKFAEKTIPVQELLIMWAQAFFRERLPMIDIEKDLQFHFNLSNQSSPGKTDEAPSLKGTRRYWFEPRGLFDLQEFTRLVSNDTSLGVGYAPRTPLEMIVLGIEASLNSSFFRQAHPWIGTDIKIMGFRSGIQFFITLCIPQIARYVENIDAYRVHIETARQHILSFARKQYGVTQLGLSINTRDDYEKCELYLTATGSSIESGDEGLVGRGNRITGVISPLRPFSMEGSCGKNPVYHIGKVYYLAAQKISNAINDRFGIPNEVFLASQSGRDLLDPWIALINVPPAFIRDEDLRKLFLEEVGTMQHITDMVLRQTLPLF